MKQTILTIDLKSLKNLNPNIRNVANTGLLIECFTANNHVISEKFSQISSQKENSYMVQIDQKLSLKSYIEDEIEVVLKAESNNEVIGLGSTNFESLK